MPRRYRQAYQCPFFIRGFTHGLRCEGGELVFPDALAAQDHASAFCANECGWRRCSIAVTLERYYDRKEDRKNGKSDSGAQGK